MGIHVSENQEGHQHQKNHPFVCRKIIRIPSINKIKKPKNPKRLNVEIENIDKINFIANKFKQGILEMLTYSNQISS
jgi:hypothetical protein